MNYIPVDKIQWKRVRYIKSPLEATDTEAIWKYDLWINEPLASWDVFSYWERERVASMERHLTKDDVLIDVGTEQGWCNLVYAKIVGPEHMILVEPTPEFWPNIKALWEKNFPGQLPMACVCGFLSNITKGNIYDIEDGFPQQANGDLIDRNSYRNISSDADTIPQITADYFSAESKIIPTALTIDVEGAELLVLQGAEKLLKEHDMKVWVSEHDDLAEKQYGIKPGEVATFMESLGYSREVLATDHERHVYYHRARK